MMTTNKEVKFNKDGIPYATLQEYGFKDYSVLKKILNVLGKVLLVLIVMMLYLSIFIIFLQSINSSKSVTEFEHVTLYWYTHMFEKRSLTSAIEHTLIISISATLISTVLGTLIAVGINSFSKKQRQNILLLNNVPLLNADIVTGTCLMIVFSCLIPIFPYFFGWKTLLLAHMFFTLPYVVLSVLPKLKEIDPNLLDAALDLGVKPYKSLVKVIVPAVKAGIFSGSLLAFTMSFDDFVVSYYTTGNGFNNLSIWIYSSIGRTSLTPSVYAFSTLVTLITLAVVIVIGVISGRGGKKHAKHN